MDRDRTCLPLKFLNYFSCTAFNHLRYLDFHAALENMKINILAKNWKSKSYRQYNKIQNASYKRQQVVKSYYSSLLLTFNEQIHFPACSYMSKDSNRNIRARYEICSKLTIKIPERGQWCRSGIFIVNLEDISHFF